VLLTGRPSGSEFFIYYPTLRVSTNKGGVSWPPGVKV